ncbi:putative LLM family oxidoreductase [Nakamurella sp. UYEF19]|uniref:LLM class flavin-dependent oxidoreductase n=1 Tax=Nakamurella sp. UYEF19 TaxID=1756392 RepID=UPI003395E2C7
MTQQLELGLDTFGDVTVDANGKPVPQPQVIRNLVEQAVLADQVGLDFIGIGEHHRADFAVTAPDVVLSAIAGRTANIHLGSAVTVLSSDDPVRVFQRFATLDAVSNGRAEVILGRGSFTESFPLFGEELSDYDRLFEEKVELFAALRSEGPVTWSGTTRSGLDNQSVFPHTDSGALKTWLGVGGSPESVVRAARYGFGLLLAIIGGEPARFAPYSDLFHRALDQFGTGPAPIGVHSPGHVSDTDEQAKEEIWEHHRDMMSRIGRERGWPALTRDRFEADVVQGSLYVGSPETVATKIASTVKAIGADRFDLKYSNGTLPHEQMMRSIELYGTKVAPMVRDMLA